MKKMPTAVLPADSEYVYVPDTDSWIVQKKSGNKVLSKKEASLIILARLEEIHSNLLKQAIQQQDVVDFYLLSLLPPDYLQGDEIGTEHYDALSIFKSIIMSLRDEYIERGMDELKDEAKTTRWVKAIPEEDMPEDLKPYYKYHDEPFRSRHEFYEDDDRSWTYTCYNCQKGLEEGDAYIFNDETYCEDCEGEAINDAIKDNVAYCTTHNVFVTDDEGIKEYMYDYPVSDAESHPVGPEHQLVRYKEGVPIWDEIQENAKKQLQLEFPKRRKKREQKQPKQLNLPQPTSMAFPEASLKQACEGGSSGQIHSEDGWWEAPHNFDDYSSTDFYKIFALAPWKSMYGGPLWAEVAKTITQMEGTTDWQKLMVLIDHFHDLGHNTGKLLDKFSEWHKWFKEFLDEKAKKNSLRYLLQRASGPVKNLVTDYLRTYGKTWVEEEEERESAESKLEVGDEAIFNGQVVTILKIFEPSHVADVQYTDGKKDRVVIEDLKEIDMPAAVSSQKVQLRKLSKKHEEEAICPSCGEWKPTDFSPEQLKEMDWECLDCSTKRALNPQDLPENRGQKEITTFDPEYQWLLKLINVVTKAGVPAHEIKALSTQHPFVTIDDAGDLAAQIWTLATERYHIPREWLMKKLPEKKASLKKQAEIIEIGLTSTSPLFPIFINPTPNEALGLLARSQTGELRYLFGEDGNTYLWDGYHGVHFDVINELHALGFDVDAHTPQGEVVGEKAVRQIFGTLNTKAYEGGYPTEEDATYMGGGPQGTVAYEPAKHDSQTGRRERDDGEPIVICPKCKSNKVAKEGEQVKCQACGTNFIPEPDRGSDDPTVNDYSQNYFFGPRDLGTVPNKQPGDSFWQPWGTENSDGVSSNVMMSSFKSFMRKQSNLNKVAHCGPCSVLKMEALHILIDLYYKDNDLFPEEVIEELSVATTELEVDNFNDILESVIEEYLEEKAEEVGDKLPKLKNLLIALKDIAPKLGNEIEIVDKQAMLKQAFGTVKNVLIICSGNTCRSPMAENILRSIRPDLNVVSRGLYVSKGGPMSPPAEVALKEKGIPYQPHTSKQVDANDVNAADLILTMEQWQKEEVVKQFPQAKSKTFLLGSKEIQDPVGGKAEDYQRIRDEIAQELGKMGSLDKQAKEVPTPSNKEEYPKISKPKSGYVDNGIGYTCGRCEYFNPEREKCKKVEGTIKSFGCCNFWDGEGKFKEKNKTAEKALETDKRALTKEEAVYVQYPNVDYRCDECAFFNAEAKTCTKVDGEISPTASCNFWQPIKNKQANLIKQANPPSRFWIAPDGKEFEVFSAGHGKWIQQNLKTLKQYGINPSEDLDKMNKEMYDRGWSRISNEPAGSGFQIQVADVNKVPSYLDDFIAKHFKKGETILVGDIDGEGIEITDPFPTLQKAINKKPKFWASQKQASLLDEVLDQTTQDAIASEYGPAMLIALRFYNDGIRYGQNPQRSMAYALDEIKKMGRPINQKDFLEVLDTYFQ